MSDPYSFVDAAYIRTSTLPTYVVFLQFGISKFNGLHDGGTEIIIVAGGYIDIVMLGWHGLPFTLSFVFFCFFFKATEEFFIFTHD